MREMSETPITDPTIDETIDEEIATPKQEASETDVLSLKEELAKLIRAEIPPPKTERRLLRKIGLDLLRKIDGFSGDSMRLVASLPRKDNSPLSVRILTSTYPSGPSSTEALHCTIILDQDNEVLTVDGSKAVVREIFPSDPARSRAKNQPATVGDIERYKKLLDDLSKSGEIAQRETH